MKIPPRQPRFSARTRELFAATGLPALFAVRAAKDDAPAEILLYDEIGPWGVTAKDFARAITALGAGPITVRINSPGGDVFHGLAMYNTLKAHPGGVTCVVDGLAASAASYVAMAADDVQMAESSMLMIHNCWGFVVGNKADMTEAAGTFGRVDAMMANIYAGKTGKPADEIAGLMDAETWLTGAEAKEAGFCDTLVAPVDKADARAGAKTIPAVAARALVRSVFDPDGDGDDDAAEAIAAILAAQESLGDALAALTGAPDDDATEQARVAAAEAEAVAAAAAEAALNSAREKIALRARIAVAL